MERRKFVIGLGAVSTGAAAGIGTGAFNQMTTEPRDANISIVNDSDGVIALIPGRFGDEADEDTLPVYENDEGDLVIDLSYDGEAGINTNSRYVFGDIENRSLDQLPEGTDESLTEWYSTVYDGDGGEEASNTDTPHDDHNMFKDGVTVSEDEYLFAIQNNDEFARDIWLGIDSHLGNRLGVGGDEVDDEDGPSWAVWDEVPPGGHVAVGLLVNAGPETQDVEGAIRVSADRDDDLY